MYYSPRRLAYTYLVSLIVQHVSRSPMGLVSPFTNESRQIWIEIPEKVWDNGGTTYFRELPDGEASSSVY